MTSTFLVYILTLHHVYGFMFFSPFIAVMFEEGILLGAETDTSLLACDAASHHQPLTVVERTVSVPR